MRYLTARLVGMLCIKPYHRWRCLWCWHRWHLRWAYPYRSSHMCEACANRQLTHLHSNRPMAKEEGLL